MTPSGFESRGGQSRAGQSRAGQSRAGQSRAGESRAGVAAGHDPGAAEPAVDPIVTKTLSYRLVRFCVRSYLRLFHRMRAEAVENLPPAGPCLIVSNHQSFMDIPLIAASTGRHVCFVARESLLRSRFMRWLIPVTGAETIRRGTADRRALQAMIRHLELGDSVAIFPEGTRSPDGSLGEFHGGALLAARRTGAPIVPTGIRGTVDALNRDATWPSPGRRVAVRYAPQIDPKGRDAMDRTREAIAEMVGAGHFESVAPIP